MLEYPSKSNVMNTVTASPQIYGQLISAQTVDRVVRTIRDYFHPEKIILFGSYATEQATEDSDLDLLIVMKTDLPRHKRATPIRMLFQPMPCAMDILVYTPDEVVQWNGTVNHIITEIFQHGKVLYER